MGDKNGNETRKSKVKENLEINANVKKKTKVRILSKKENKTNIR